MNLVNTIKDLVFAGNNTSEIANQLGAPESNVKTGMGALVPVILSGLINRGNTSGGGIMDLINSAGPLLGGNNSNLGGLLGSVVAGNNANSNIFGNILGGLFGNRADHITNGVSTHSGLKQGTVVTLLTALAPFIIGQVKKYFSTSNINTEGEAVRFMNTQKDYVAAAMPAGLSLASLFGNSDDNVRTSHATTTHTTTHTNYQEPERKKSSMGWLWLLLLAGLGLLLYSMLGDGCKKSADTPATVDTLGTNATATTTVAADTNTPAATTRTLGEVVTANGVKLQAYPNGVEEQLIKFLATEEYRNATDDQLKNRWFDFDDLNFEFGTTTLTPASKRQLDNIVAILKAYPDVKMKIGAYTDRVGDDAKNLKLSQSRADAVKAAIDKAGVGAQIIGAEGYGEQFATVDEKASDAEREKDRRTAIRIAKK